MQLTPTVYWAAGAPFATLGNVYAIRSEKGIILVDAGNPNTEATILRTLNAWGLGGHGIPRLADPSRCIGSALKAALLSR